jgi:hypothetical protein
VREREIEIESYQSLSSSLHVGNGKEINFLEKELKFPSFVNMIGEQFSVKGETNITRHA